MSQATFHVVAPAGERWTARAAQELVGRPVRYGRLGRVGAVEAATPVNAGAAVRLQVHLSRRLLNPDRLKFRLGK